MNLDKMLQIAGISRKLLKENSEWISQIDVEDAPPVETNKRDNRIKQFANIIDKFGFKDDLVNNFNWITKFKKWEFLSYDERDNMSENIPAQFLPKLTNFPDEYIRYEVAKRIDPEYLPQMMNDDSEDVKYEVAIRIDPEYLPQMMNDESWAVRCEVATRIDPEYLPQMMDDPRSEVERVVQMRINNAWADRGYKRKPEEYKNLTESQRRRLGML